MIYIYVSQLLRFISYGYVPIETPLHPSLAQAAAKRAREKAKQVQIPQNGWCLQWNINL